MKKVVQYLFRKPLLQLINKFSSAPDKDKIFEKLSTMLLQLQTNAKYNGKVINNLQGARYVIMSDMHKGNGDDADDFNNAKEKYINALNYYCEHNYNLILLGDVEELWENNIVEVIVTHQDTYEIENEFAKRNMLYKIYGNHDLFWNTNNDATKWLAKMYSTPMPVYESILIQLPQHNNVQILLTHGHQGDKQSDGNKLSKWFVANIWNKVQAYLDININTPSKDYLLRNKHNKIMYNWSAAQPNTILITGHTHKPVFASLNHVQKIMTELKEAKYNSNNDEAKRLTLLLQVKLEEYIAVEQDIPQKPTYFNTGCCCYNDGDITLIELNNDAIKLVKWTGSNNNIHRQVLQKENFKTLLNKMN